MKLLKIEIIGFKSFADKVKLEFHQGITGIVGPNGCGKSNIADAFRWVLGEQSAKSMRGGKMLDVIFAGTTSRKPLNFAEVTITLGEINGALQVDYEEVAITRRLHRNGESEYFLNRQPIRLKDLHALFLDSGIGKDAYSIFEQGKIDQIIYYTPMERRCVFEEAAGILRFLQRKREALRKLEQSDFNISRIKDIHREIEQRIVILKDQAEKARLYKDQKGELEHLEKVVVILKWDALKIRLEEADAKGDDQKKRIEDSLQHLAKMKQEVADARAQLEGAEKKVRLKREELYQTRSDKEIKTKEKINLQDRLKELLAKEKQWQVDLEQMLQKQEERQTERSQLQKQQSSLEGELSTRNDTVKAQLEKTQTLEAQVGNLRERQQSIQKEHLHLVRVENQLDVEQRQTSVKLEHAQERFAELDTKISRLANHRQSLVEKTAEKQKQVDEIAKGIDIQKADFEQKGKDLENWIKESERLQKDLEKIRREATGHEARHKVLMRLKQDMEGFSPGAKRLLSESSNPKSPLHNKLSNLFEWITPKKGSEAKLAAVMKPYSHTLVTKERGDFETVLDYAKKHNLSDFSLICLSDLPHHDEPVLADVVDAPLSRHFFQAVLSAKNYPEALQKKVPGKLVWIEEGGLLDQFHVAGYHTQKENNAFLREAEIKELEIKLAEGEKTRIHYEEELKKAQHMRAQLQTERTEMDKAFRKQEMVLIEHNFALQRLKGDLEQAKKEAAQLELDREGLFKSIASLKSTFEDLAAKHAQAKAKASEAIAKTEGLNSELENQQAEFKKEQRALQERETALHKTLEDNRKISHMLHVLEVKDNESRQQAARLREELKQSKDLKEQLSSKGVTFEQAILDAEKLLAETSEACSKQEAEVSALKRTIEAMESKVQDAQSRIKKQEGDAYQAGLQKAQLQTAIQTIENETLERYQVPIHELRTHGLVLDKPLDQAEKQVKKLRQQLESAGDVNMMSIAEYEEQTQRFELLDRELGDMQVSKQELMAIISQLDEESRSQFTKTFNEIRENFKKNFTILFNGGEADLQFTETNDVLEAGIEIIAKPPGKQMRSISLLSGGEKCMTAMALLFAIFEVKPSPFCILDEIDAPLDDSNIERFVNMLKQFTGKCQFIIITHNKRTMAIADLLFGVSMEERGVSKILSMNFVNQKQVQLV